MDYMSNLQKKSEALKSSWNAAKNKTNQNKSEENDFYINLFNGVTF